MKARLTKSRNLIRLAALIFAGTSITIGVLQLLQNQIVFILEFVLAAATVGVTFCALKLNMLKLLLWISVLLLCLSIADLAFIVYQTIRFTEQVEALQITILVLLFLQPVFASLLVTCITRYARHLRVASRLENEDTVNAQVSESLNLLPEEDVNTESLSEYDDPTSHQETIRIPEIDLLGSSLMDHSAVLTRS